MTMFGAPPLMLAFAMGGGAVLGMVWEAAERLCRKCLGRVWHRAVALGAALCVVLFLAWPLAMLLPDLTQGPVISQQHAQALQARAAETASRISLRLPRPTSPASLPLAVATASE